MTSLPKAAIEWARRGLPVFPLQPRSKYPYPGSHGCKDATRNEAQIAEWWRQFPDANIGLATGDGIFVVDPDGQDAESWYFNACGRHGEPEETLEVKTSRGRHIFFWASVEIPNSASLLAPHVDVRGTGGYVVGAPSVHPDGTVYSILHDSPITEAPRWLIDLAIPDEVLKAPLPAPLKIPLPATARDVWGVASIADLVASSQPGERNQLLFWAACRFAEKIASGIFGQAFAIELLYDAARSSGLTDREISSTIRSAFRKAS